MLAGLASVGVGAGVPGLEVDDSAVILTVGTAERPQRSSLASSGAVAVVGGSPAAARLVALPSCHAVLCCAGRAAVIVSVTRTVTGGAAAAHATVNATGAGALAPAHVTATAGAPVRVRRV